jgi:GrpB-like predicted nucleotidyltransferase (UPF0157 family)
VGGGRRRAGYRYRLTDPDPAWPRQYDIVACRIREALGWRVLQLEHVGSTSVPGLAAKPVIDIDLTVADPGREQDDVPRSPAVASVNCAARRRGAPCSGDCIGGEIARSSAASAGRW